MKAVWKYDVPIDDDFTLRMPEGAKILSGAVQRGSPVIWALVDTQASDVSRHFILRGTGHSIVDEKLTFIASFFLRDGALIFHLFEVTP